MLIGLVEQWNRWRRSLSTPISDRHVWVYFDGGNCYQEIKMAEQKYSESDSTSSDSTMQVKNT